MMYEVTKDKLGNTYYDTEQEVADKVQACEKGVCPICENENIKYGSMELDGESAFYPCYCTRCGANWNEWYTLEFTGNDSITIEE